MSNETVIEKENELCQQYVDKINSCLPFLRTDDTTSISNDISYHNLAEAARSLLKQPTSQISRER